MVQQAKKIGTLLNAEHSQKTRRLIVLGASGSVGSSCMEFLSRDVSMQAVAVSVHTGVIALRKILGEHHCMHAAISNPDAYSQHVDLLKSDFPTVNFYGGANGVQEMIHAATEDSAADTVLTAVVGAAGIQATILSLQLGLKIALANKETMVTAGPAIQALLADQIREKGPSHSASILPVDSEHNAVFQLVHGLPDDHLQKIILTASGGPFRDRPVADLALVRREEVLNHPTWSMGPKITVDSAGMINKGLEIIEAHYLFSIGYDRLDVLIHKHSLVHAMVATRDGGYLICASSPHMIFPIAHSLYFPESLQMPHSMSNPPETWAGLEFEPVVPEKYPGFELCVQAGKQGGTAPAVLNAANEVAVELFLQDLLSFVQIPQLIASILDITNFQYGTELELFLEADRLARIRTHEMARQLI